MTIKGLIKSLKKEITLCDQQITFNYIKGHDDLFEKGYKSALEMVLKNLEDMGEQIPVRWIEDWSSYLWLGASDLVCEKLIKDWRKKENEIS